MADRMKMNIHEDQNFLVNETSNIVITFRAFKLVKMKMTKYLRFRSEYVMFYKL